MELHNQDPTMMKDFWIAECPDLRKGRGMGWAIPLALMVLQ